MQRENLLDADAIGQTADGDGLLDATVLLGDHNALEDLDTLAGAFLDLDVDADGVADVGNGLLSLHLLAFEFLDEIHGYFLLIYRRS